MAKHLKQKESDRSPAQPADKLLALLNITQRLNSERDVPSLLRVIAQEAARLLDAELASLFLLDESGRELWSMVTLDTDDTLRFDADQGIAGEALKTGRIVRVDDAHRDPRFFSGIDAATPDPDHFDHGQVVLRIAGHGSSHLHLRGSPGRIVRLETAIAPEQG